MLGINEIFTLRLEEALCPAFVRRFPDWFNKKPPENSPGEMFVSVVKTNS